MRQRNVDLEAAVARLEDLLKVSDQKNMKFVNRAKETDATTHRATQENSSTLEELHEVWTSAESYHKLSETLESQISQSEVGWKKMEESLKESRDKCGRFREWYRFWRAKATWYLAELSCVPWLRDLVWAQGLYWGFKNCRYLIVNRDRYNITRLQLILIFWDSCLRPLMSWRRLVEICSRMLLKLVPMRFIPRMQIYPLSSRPWFSSWRWWNYSCFWTKSQESMTFIPGNFFFERNERNELFWTSWSSDSLFWECTVCIVFVCNNDCSLYPHDRD